MIALNYMKLLLFTYLLVCAIGLVAQSPPQLVRDIEAGSANSVEYEQGVAFRGRFFFPAHSNQQGTELWESDGTQLGTKLVRDLTPGAESSNPSDLIVVGNLLYFIASTPGTGQELFVTNGTRSGTRIVKDLLPGPESGIVNHGLRSFGQINNILLFAAQDIANNTELWRTDGTLGGTYKILDIEPEAIHSSGSFPRDFASNAAMVYFTAEDGVTNRQLYRSDGTTEGTLRVTEFTNTFNGLFMVGRGFLNEDFYFGAYGGENSYDLFKLKPTQTRPERIIDFVHQGMNVPTRDGNLNRFATLNGKLIFAANAFGEGADLWTSDGSTAGSRMFYDCEPPTTLPNTPENFTVVDKTLYFKHSTSATGRELWKTDGTSAGTQLVADLKAGRFHAFERTSYIYGHEGKVYFGANGDGSEGNEDSGIEAYYSNGLTTGTSLLEDLHNGIESSSPSGFTSVGNQLFFYADNGTNGREVFVTENREPLTATLQSSTDISCFGENDGAAVISIAGGTTEVNGTNGNRQFNNLPPGDTIIVISDTEGNSVSVPVNIQEPEQVVLNTLAHSAEISDTSSLILLVEGGTPPYTYQWADTTSTDSIRTELRPGTYVVTVTDTRGCLVTGSYLVTATRPPFSVVATATTPVACFGESTGTVTIDVNGGATNENGTNGLRTITGLSMGDTTLVINDGDTTSTIIQVSIGGPSLPVIVEDTFQGWDIPDTSTISVVVRGGTPPYTITWNGVEHQDSIFTDLSPGSYTLIVTDANGCSTSTSYSVVRTELPLEIRVVSITPTSCHDKPDGTAFLEVSGGTTDLDGTDGPRARINLSKGVNSYSFTDMGGNTVMTEFFVDGPPPLVLDALIPVDAPYDMGSISLLVSGGTYPYRYEWGDSVESDSSRVDLATNQYHVTVTDGNDCITNGEFLVETLGKPNAVASFADADIELWPTIVYQVLRIEAPTRIAALEIFGTDGGRFLSLQHLNTRSLRLSPRQIDLPAGAYVVRLTMPDGQVSIGKFIKR